MSHSYFLRKKILCLRNKIFCPKNAFTLFHIAMNTLKKDPFFPYCQNSKSEDKQSNKEYGPQINLENVWNV